MTDSRKENPKPILTKISISGYTKKEIDEGIDFFHEEFSKRPWNETVKTNWDAVNSLFIVEIKSYGDEPENRAEGVFDEVWDVAQASFDFAGEKISFEINESKFVE